MTCVGEVLVREGVESRGITIHSYFCCCFSKPVLILCKKIYVNKVC